MRVLRTIEPRMGRLLRVVVDQRIYRSFGYPAFEEYVREPATVVALLRDVLDAFADPEAPRWTALQRLLRHVITHWESTPRHHDPIFARDGWRCTVPACSSRRNLHDHHIHFRSRGGDNRRDNCTAVCAAHHLHGLHDGTIRASGIAPHAIEWHLGVRPGAPPFLSCVGDRLCPSHDAGKAAHRVIR